MKNLLIILILTLALSCKEDKKQDKAKPKTEVTATKKISEKTEEKSEKETKTAKTAIKTEKTEDKIPAIAFLKNVKSLEKDTSTNPIESFKKQASKTAKKVIKIKKSNIAKSLDKIEDYNYAVFTVGDYTIIKITNLEDCKTSGAWKTCMPMGEGYIKKGKLLYQNDYLNNIIGLPDSQERLLFLF